MKPSQFGLTLATIYLRFLPTSIENCQVNSSIRVASFEREVISLVEKTRIKYHRSIFSVRDCHVSEVGWFQELFIYCLRISVILINIPVFRGLDGELEVR